MTHGATPPARPSTVMRLTPLATVLDRLAERLRPLPAQQLSIHAAIGAVLAADAGSMAAVPPSPTALRDGWAVLASDTVGASPYGPALLSTPPRWVAANEALPAGTDAVLPPGAMDAAGSIPAALEAAAPFENVRAAGAESRAGETLVRKGQRLSAHQAVACAQAGVAEVSARRASIVFDPDLDAASRAAVAVLLGQRLAGDPGGAASIRIARWTPPPSGANGLVCEAVGLAPGEASWATIENDCAVLRIQPGFGPAVAVTLAVFGPLLDRLEQVEGTPAAVSLPLARKIASRIGWSEIALLGVENGRWTPLIVGDVTVSTLSRAAAWTLVPPDSEGAPAGATLAARPFGDLP